MNSFMDGIGQVLGMWWWFGQEGQTKTANSFDDWLLPLFITVSLSATSLLVWWCCR